MQHAVAQLRTDRLARSSKPFLARGGLKGARCTGCRLLPSHCLCPWRPQVATHAGICLLMADTEPLKPSNTGWLIADVVPETFAFGWARTSTDPRLPALLQDPQWQPLVVFPPEYAAPGRVLQQLPAAPTPASTTTGRRPLFILLDGTWSEARKMFRKTPVLDSLPVLQLRPDQATQERPAYQLRRAKRGDHFCTSEVAALCLAEAGDHHAARVLQAYLDVFTHHYLQARHQLPVDPGGQAHQRLQALTAPDRACRR
ncbi:MAG: tRNA-uridine aminocarboxypropyltransferase [Pseudomonadota bacterium]